MIEAAKADGTLDRRSSDDGGFAVYIHWPFCAARCPYCDFNTHVRHGGVDALGFAAALERELEYFAERMGDAARRPAASIFFGGGTPSLMPPQAVSQLIGAVRRLWGVTRNVEITLEANPTSVDAGRFREFSEAGVNRVSVGVQSLVDEELKFLGRRHNRADAIRAIEIAHRHFPRVSFDMIYARPGQTPDAWHGELAEALTLAGEHLSLYQLTIEPDTPFARMHQAGRFIVPDSDAARALYDVTQDLTSSAGLPAYEISNHARPGGECRHNLVYWSCGDFVGVGPGAHGRLSEAHGRTATATETMPEAWRRLVETRGHGLKIDEPLDAVEQGDEYLVMGLRLASGIDPQRYAALCGRPIDADRIAELAGDGLLAEDPDGRLRVTSDGFPVLNAVVADLAA